MDRDADSREYTPYRAEPPRSRAVSAVSAMDPDTAYDPPTIDADGDADLGASRDSIEVQFHQHEYLSPTSPASGTPSWASALGQRQYTPYAPLATPSRVSSISRMSRYSYASAIAPNDEANIDGESYDLALLSAAAPVAGYNPQEAAEEAADEPVDVSATLGPTTPHDAAFLKKLQQEEASGNLTGGLGRGFRPDTRMRDAELLASAASSPVQRHLSRSFSRRLGSRKMTRNQTLKYVGQDEANRQGKVIEVVVEDEHEVPGADLSVMEGTAFVGRSKDEVTHVFYPQPNWRPWPLHWPYLTMLVVLSIALAILQEMLLQHYWERPIVVFRTPNDIKPGIHFVVKFMPTLAAVVFGVLWQFADFEVRRLEPFYQLSKEGGALAAESINIDYVTMFRFLRPFYALQKKHYVVACMTAGATLAAALVPPLAAATISLSPGREERIKHPTDPKELRFNPVWCRLLTSTLAIVAACGVGVMFLNRNRRTGLLADVRGIAGLASMAVVSHILMDFKDMDTAKPNDIHNKLKRHRYMLKNSSLAPDDEKPMSSEDRAKYETGNLPEHPHPLMLRARGCITFVVYTFGFAGFVPAFLFSNMGWIPDHAPWLVTLLAVVVKLAWGSLEEAVRVMEPYYILSQRHAPSKTLTLDYTAIPWGYMPARALANGHMLVFMMGFGSIMAEFMTIMVSGLATVDGQNFLMADGEDGEKAINAGQETVPSFYISVAVSLFILLYMATVALLVWFRRRHPFLPRQPTTIASVLAFIHQSKMLYTFVGTSKLSPAQMVNHLDDGSTYGLGWFEGRDGQTHCGIDQEELISGYKHGIDFAQGIQPWNTRWDVL